MPWRRTDPVSERREFVALLKAGAYTMSELCGVFGVSRTTGHRWWARFQAEGWAGLEERSRRPLHSPSATAAPTLEWLVQERAKHPRWGPKKLLARLQRTHPELALPGRSTASRLLKRAGLVQERRRRRRPEAAFPRAGAATAPNELWTADHKGQFRMGDGRLCYPLTIADSYSRYLLRAEACGSTGVKEAGPAFEAVFREFGLPARILTDNGPPFGSAGLCGLSRLAVQWLKLGIAVERITRGHPEENGQHERMHRTLKVEATQPAENNARAQQRRLDAFRREYNEERPHEALAQRTPAEFYEKSRRIYHRRDTPGLDYPLFWARRQVRTGGVIKWRGGAVFISEVLEGEPVGLEEIDDELWNVHFASVLLGRIRGTEPKLLHVGSGYASAAAQQR